MALCVIAANYCDKMARRKRYERVFGHTYDPNRYRPRPTYTARYPDLENFEGTQKMC